MKRRKWFRAIAVLAALCLAVLIYTDRSPKTYHLELASGDGGTIPAGLASVLDGDYESGTKIRLVAREMKGYSFDRWISSGGGEFDDPEDSGAVFIMPANDVTVTAHFTQA